MSGTAISICLRTCYALSGTERACYAFSGTDIAYGCAIGLCACYAVYGTEIAHATMCLYYVRIVLAIYLRDAWYCPSTAYAIHGTDAAYGATSAKSTTRPEYYYSSPYLVLHYLARMEPYSGTACPLPSYAVSGTDVRGMLLPGYARDLYRAWARDHTDDALGYKSTAKSNAFDLMLRISAMVLRTSHAVADTKICYGPKHSGCAAARMGPKEMLFTSIAEEWSDSAGKSNRMRAGGSGHVPLSHSILRVVLLLVALYSTARSHAFYYSSFVCLLLLAVLHST
eukprot:1560293-Rhodomonas_salina.1